MKKSALVVCLLTVGALFLAPLSTRAQESSSSHDPEATTDFMSAIGAEVEASDRTVKAFEKLAGSHQNAQNLVIGLRNDKPVKMTVPEPATPEVNFTPSTPPMSFSDIHKALSLAQAQLKAKRITKPTPAQVKAALVGGELPNENGEMTQVIGILPLHRRGMSWEEIARTLGLNVPKRVVMQKTLSSRDG